MKSVFTYIFLKNIYLAIDFRVCLLLLCFCSLLGTYTHAGHIKTVEISYEHQTGNTFQVTLVLYRDCAGISAPNGPLTANAVSTSCGKNYLISLVRQPDPVGGSEVSPLCGMNSTCNGGSIPGVEKYLYIGTIDLQNNFCDDWVFSYSYCCRSTGIDNLAGVGNQYVEATMNNSIVAGDTIWNNSPSYTSLLIPYICINQTFNFHQGTVDTDGDSLSYSLINSLSGPGANVPFASGYTSIDPIISLPSITIDSLTGRMTMKPTILQNCMIVVKVEEWREINGTMTKVGTTMRDVWINVMNCNNQQPTIDPAIGMQGVTNGVKTGAFDVNVCPGDSLYFYFVAVDNNGNNILMTSNLDTNNMPTASFSYSCVCPADTGFFGWRPSPADIGLNVLMVTIQDDGCPILGSQYYSFNIWVGNSLDGGHDKVYCGIPQTLSAAGGDTLVWTVLSGDSPIIIGSNFSDDTIIVGSESSAQAYPSITTTYLVTSNLPVACGNTDTVIVTVAPPFTLTAVSDTTICLNGVATLDIPLEDTAYGSYSYSWMPTATLGTPLQKSTLAQPFIIPLDSVYYYVTAIAPSGCVREDTVKVIVKGTAPSIVASVTNTNLCVGDTTRLSCTILPGATYQWTPSAGLFDSTGVSTQPDTLASPWAAPITTTVYAVEVDTTTVTNCPGADFVTIIVGANYSVTASASTRLLCRGDTTQLTATPSIGGTYSYSWIPSGSITSDTIANPSAFPTDTTIYTVISDNGGCLQSDTVQINLKPPPPSLHIAIDSPYGSYLCAGDSTSLRATLGFGSTCDTVLGSCSSPLSDSINYPTFNLTAMGHLTGAKTGWAFKSQVLYTLSDLMSIGMVANDMISAIGFRCAAGMGSTVNDLEIRMRCTSSPGWTTADTTFITGLTTVMAPFSYTAVAGWNTFTFDNPYVWDGVSNLVVEFCTNTFQSNDVYFAFDTLIYSNLCRYIVTQSMTDSSQCAVAMGLPYANFTVTGIPETKFKFCSSPVIPSSNNEYNWSPTTNLSNPNDSATMAWPTTTTTYMVTAWDSTSNGCVSERSVSIQVGHPDSLNIAIGDDDTVCGSVTLDGGPNLASYLWSDSSMNRTLLVDTTGSYFVIVQDIYTCADTDSINLMIKPVVDINFGNDTTLCSGASMILDAGPSFSSYLWSDSSTGQSLVVDSVGVYWVIAVNSVGCISSDTIIILVSNPTVGLGPDQSFCDGKYTTLNAGPGFTDYLWSTGWNNQTINVYSSGTYSVRVQDAYGCYAYDTIVVTEHPLPQVFLGKDTLICAGDSLLLDGGAGFFSYLWSTASTTRTIFVKNSGTYGVAVMDTNGCIGYDTIIVTVDTCIGIHEISNGVLTIFPNPTVGKVFINVGDMNLKSVTIELIGIRGELLYSNKVAIIDKSIKYLDLSAYTKGIYYLKITTETQHLVKKLVVQ